MRKFITKVLRFIKPDKEPSIPGLWILLIPLTIQRRTRKIFYDGPSVYNYPGRKMKGYRSPNLLIGIWLHALMLTWLTPMGRMMLVLSGAFMFFGLISIQMPAYILAFGLVSLFVIDFCVGWWYRPRLIVNRDHTGLAETGSSIRLDYTISNTGKVPCWDLMVDILPVANGEVPEGVSFLRSIQPGEELQANHELTIKRRGLYDLPIPLASSAFPFGFWRWGSRGPASPPINVYPTYTMLETLDFPMGRDGEQGKELLTSRASDSNEFMGCREYRYGDNPRLIHARSWARLGMPVVKEFREEYLPHAALFIDNFCPLPGYWARFGRPQVQSLEALLSLAAAIADKLTKDNYLLDVFCPGWQSTHIKESHGPDQLDAVLELTACIEPNFEDKFHACQREQMSRIEELQNLLILLLDWDEGRQTFVQELLERNVGVKVVLVHPEADRITSGTQLVGVSAQDVLDGKIIKI